MRWFIQFHRSLLHSLGQRVLATYSVAGWLLADTSASGMLDRDWTSRTSQVRVASLKDIADLLLTATSLSHFSHSPACIRRYCHHDSFAALSISCKSSWLLAKRIVQGCSLWGHLGLWLVTIATFCGCHPWSFIFSRSRSCFVKERLGKDRAISGCNIPIATCDWFFFNWSVANGTDLESRVNDKWWLGHRDEGLC